MLKARTVVSCFARVRTKPHLKQLLLKGVIRRHQPLQVLKDSRLDGTNA